MNSVKTIIFVILSFVISPQLWAATTQWQSLKENCQRSSQKVIVQCEVRKWVWDIYGQEDHKQILPVKTAVSAQVKFKGNQVVSNSKKEVSYNPGAQEENVIMCPYIAQEEVTYGGPVQVKCSELDLVTDDFVGFCHQKLGIGTQAQVKFEIQRKIVPNSIRSACTLIGKTSRQLQLKDQKPKIFDQQVMEAIKVTGLALQEFESKISEPLNQLDQLNAQILAANCNENTRTPACKKLKQQISEMYLTFLETMDVNLDPLSNKVYRATEILGAKLENVMGGKTLKDLQQEFLGEGKEPKSMSQVSEVLNRRSSGQSLSRRFKRYLEIINLHGSQKQSLTLLAADIYAGLKESLSYVELINANIHNSKIMLQLANFSDDVNHDTVSLTISSVRDFLFGEASDTDTQTPVEIDFTDTKSATWEQELGIK